MTLIEESLRYAGMSYFGIEDSQELVLQKLDRAELYYRWGRESGERDDFIQAAQAFSKVEDGLLDENRVLAKYEKELDSVLKIIQLGLKAAVEDFDFLCVNRLKLELRDIVFEQQLALKLYGFMDEEEARHVDAELSKQKLMELRLDDSRKESRKIILETFSAGLQELEQGIDAFYQRVKKYISENSKKN